MTLLQSIKPVKPARIGLYSVGLQAYWAQFPGLRERLIGYGEFLAKQMQQHGEVFNFGLVDTPARGLEAGEWFNRHNVDLVFCHSATYVTSDCVVPIHQVCKAPAVVLNLQPASRINYDQTTTGEWLAQCSACPTPELANAFNRAGIPVRFISGLLGLSATPEISLTDERSDDQPEAVRAHRLIREYILAARVKRNLLGSRFGFLGNNYSGMLDMYSDFALIAARTGIHVEILEMCDLDACLKQVTSAEVAEKLQQIKEMFIISDDSPADPIARRPSVEQLAWAARVAAAQERMVRERELDALTYYYHGAPGGDYEKLQSGFIFGHSLLTARGIPCSGEGDLKTNVAMKICDLLGTGGSYSELVVTDYQDKTILMGHDGPFHIAIAEGKPILRGLGLYHGKQGSGVSVEAKVRRGPVTLLGLTQTREDGVKLIISEGEATAGPIMKIGNTQTPVRFALDPDDYLEKWLLEAPTHHFAMSVGHNAAQFSKVAELLGIRASQI